MFLMRSVRKAINDPLKGWKGIFVLSLITIIFCAVTVQLNYLYLSLTVLAGNLGISTFGHIADSLILASFVFTVFVCTSRYLFSVTIVLGCYCAFIAASYQKILLFEAPLFPQDVLLLTDLFLAKDSLIAILPYAGITLIVFASISVVAWRKSTNSFFSLRIRGKAMLGLYLLCISVIGVLSVELDSNESTEGRYLSVRNWFPLNSATSSGLLLEYLMEIRKLKRTHTPPKYNQTEIDSIISRHALDLPVIESGISPPVNLIIYLVEAFVDPRVMNVQTSRDSIPTFRHLMETSSSGTITSPSVGGGSANAEFEILTGMSMRLLGKGVTPYRHSLKKRTNSLATELHKHGYRSTAMHVASLGFYNYREAYQNLGFDEWKTLWKEPGVEMHIAGRMPSDQALVNDIIQTSEQHKPYFIFAFPNSTHHPWNYSGYESSSLDIVGDYSERQRKALKVYVNALNAADQAIDSLISHFSKEQEKTAILILGDHLPAMHKIDNANNIFPQADLDPIDKVQVLHQLNAVLWTNYGAEKKDFDLSLNLLATRVLEEMQIKPSGFFGLNDKLRKEIGVFSMLVRNSSGGLQRSTPKKYRSLTRDYALLQYDWLYGEQFQKQSELNLDSIPSQKLE